jgi:hypothetical protein
MVLTFQNFWAQMRSDGEVTSGRKGRGEGGREGRRERAPSGNGKWVHTRDACLALQVFFF